MVFHPAILTHSRIPVKRDHTESERSSAAKMRVRKTFLSLILGGGAACGKRLRIIKLGRGKENNTRASVWASFGPVSRIVTFLQANDSRFLSTTILTLRGSVVFSRESRFHLCPDQNRRRVRRRPRQWGEGSCPDYHTPHRSTAVRYGLS